MTSTRHATIKTQRWTVLAAGIASLLLTLGVARFAYTPLLPLMRQQAALGMQEAGWLAAINYAGYLAGALLSSMIKDIVVKDRLFRIGMMIAVASTAMMGIGHTFWLWAASRFLAGLTSAAGMLLGGALILNWLIRHGQRPELGINFAGIGLGIAGSAAVVALLSPGLDWQAQWWVFTAIGTTLLWPVLAWLPSPDRSAITTSGTPLTDHPPTVRVLTLLMTAYFFAGIGYVVSATFIVAIVDALPGLAGRGTLVFLWLGIGAAPSSILFDYLARRIGDIHSLLFAALVQILGILMPLWPGGLLFADLGALICGATFVGIVSLVLTMAGRYYPTRPAKMMGRMTLAYGSAQILGPALTATLAVHFGGYAVGLYLAAASMAAAVVLLFILTYEQSRTARSAHRTG
jgi:predicted MFS family arabinose efflux permease